MSGAHRGRRRRHVHRRDPPRGRRPRPGAQAALDAAELRPGRRRGGLRACRDATVAPASSEVVHGTTVATNAVLQRLGAETALVTTEHFRDVLELRRLRIPHMYDLFWAQAAAARRAAPALRDRRADGRRRHRREGARRRRGARRSPAACASSGSTRSPSASCTPTSTPSTSERVGAILAEELPGGDDLALERDPARAARVRALGDDGGERLRAAADVVVHRPDPHRPRRDRAGGGAARDHAVVGRRDDLRRREAAARSSRSSPARPPASSRRSAWRSGSGSRTRSPSTWAARRPRRR